MKCYSADHLEICERFSLDGIQIHQIGKSSMVNEFQGQFALDSS